MKNVLILGPWIGEYSYELCWWAPRLRRIVRENFSDYYKVIFSYPGRHILYKDFVDEYIYYPQNIIDKMDYSDCGFTRNRETHQPILESDIAQGYINRWIYKNGHLFDYVEQITPINIKLYTRGEGSLNPQDTIEEEPYGDYIFLDSSQESFLNIQKLINRYNKQPCIAIMPRIRKRSQLIFQQEYENLPIETWKYIITNIIDDLQCNIILIGIKQNHYIPGALILSQLNIEDKYKECILDTIPMNLSVEDQISILKLTKCSIYGSSGAVYLTYFANTPTFCITNNSESHRLSLKWCLKLTNNHKNVKIYNKNDLYNYSDSDPADICNEFKQFYIKL